MKSAEQIKGAVKNIAKRMNLKPQEVLQIFMFERIVERLSISEKRGSSEEIKEYKEIINEMKESKFLTRIWEKYQEENTYSDGIAFADTLSIVLQIGEKLDKF